MPREVHRGLARTILYRPSADARARARARNRLPPQKAELRTLTDMTFLKFAAIYVSPVSLFLFYLSPLAFFFPWNRYPLASSSSPVFLGRAVVSLFPPPPPPPPLDVSLARFISPPRCHPNGIYIDSSRRLGEEEEEDAERKEVILSLALSFSLSLGTFICLRRARLAESVSFSKLKTGLSTSTSGPTADSYTSKLAHSRCLPFLRWIAHFHLHLAPSLWRAHPFFARDPFV